MPKKQLAERDTTKLYVMRSTLRCAVNDGCLPCVYKIIQHAGSHQGLLHPNQRPENCPRCFEKKHDYSGPYRRGQRLLTVCDGDMSFSLALALGCGDASTVTATSHEDEATVRRVFPGGGGRHIDELRRLGCTVLFGVDATALEATFKEGERFDRIIWNFPCVARGIGEGMDGQNEEVDRTVHQNCSD